MEAKDWYFDISLDIVDNLPPIHIFLGSMAELWLNISSRDYVEHPRYALYVACMINYCYFLSDANGEKVKSQEYATSQNRAP